MTQPQGGEGEAEVGSCDLCGQEMVRTEDDCWHPYYVAAACPPEWPRPRYGVQFGTAGRPGREHFVPAASPEAEQFYATAEWHADWEDLVQSACNLAIAAHRGQVDKAGRSYFAHHVSDVAARVGWDDHQLVAVAYLHDVLEDTDVPVERIRDRFGPDITDAVLAITHRPHEPRVDYYARVKANPLALRVKLADIASNTDPARMALLDETTRVRLTEKYRKALEALA